MLGAARRAPLVVFAIAGVTAATTPIASGSNGALDRQLTIGPGSQANGVGFGGAIVGISDDGEVTAFTTALSFVVSDADAAQDLYMRSGDNLFLLGQNVSSLTRVLPSGRVVFGSPEPLVPADDDAASVDLYVADRNGALTIASDRDDDGADPGTGVQQQQLVSSDDGSALLFSTTENLLAADSSMGDDVYRYRIETNELDLISDGSSTGTPAGLSADGKTVYFHSVDSDADGALLDVYRKQDGSPATPLSGGFAAMPGGGVNGIFFAGASPDGSTVLLSTAEKLTNDDTDADVDLYANVSGALAWISGPSSGGGSADPLPARICDDAVVFTEGERLAAGDADSAIDVYRYAFPSGPPAQLSVLGAGGVEGAFDAIPAGVSPGCGELLWTTGETVAGADDDDDEDLYRSNGNAAATTLLTPTPAGGINGPVFNVFGVGANLERAFFETTGRLDADDADDAQDVYEWSAAEGLSLVSSASPVAGSVSGQLAPGPGPDGKLTGATPDGTYVVVNTAEQLVAGDNDANSSDLYGYDVAADPSPGPDPDGDGDGDGAPKDTTAPEVGVKAKSPQTPKGTKIATVKGSCNEACELVATGKFSIWRRSAKSTIKLKRAQATLEQSGEKTMNLRVSKRNAKKLKKALRKGAKATAMVKLTGTDPVGNSATASKRIKLRLPAAT